MLVPVLPAVTHYHHYLSYGLVVIQSIYDPMPAVSGASPEPAALSCRPSAALSSDCGMLRAQSSLSAEYEPSKSLQRNEHNSGLRSAPVTEDWTNGRLSEHVLQSKGSPASPRLLAQAVSQKARIKLLRESWTTSTSAGQLLRLFFILSSPRKQTPQCPLSPEGKAMKNRYALQVMERSGSCWCDSQQNSDLQQSSSSVSASNLFGYVC